MRKWLVAVAAAAVAGQSANAATIFTQTGNYDPDLGLSVLADISYDERMFAPGSVWVIADRGSFDTAQWIVDGELSKRWWDDIGEVDENGDPIPFLTGNEYSYTPYCEVSTGNPICSGAGLTMRLLSRNLLRVDWVPPADFDNCYPFPGFNIDCAESYRFFDVYYTLQVNADSAVNFRFSTTAPIPEPASWAMLIAGFGLVGAAARRRNHAASRA